MSSSGVFDVRGTMTLPAEFQSVRSGPVASLSIRSGALRAVDALSATQIFVVGAALEAAAAHAAPALDLLRAPHLLRMTALACVATLLKLAAERAWRHGPATAQLRAGGWPAALVAASATVAAFAVIAVCAFAVGGREIPPSTLAEWAAASAAAAALLKLPRRIGRPVVVVGEPGSAAELASRLAMSGASEHVRVAATLDPASGEDMDRLERLIEAGDASTVIIADDVRAPVVAAVCDRLADTSVRVLQACPGSDAPIAGPEARLGRGPEPAAVLLTDVLPQPFVGGRRAAKRAFDLAVSLTLIPILLPVLVAIPLAIRLDSPGPVLFMQWRFGQGSRRVRIYKFRTMHASMGDATGAERTLARDPRVTRVGRLLRRLSLDELPQLLNVIRGDMSLVGPRPHATHMKVEGVFYHEAVEAYRLRHRVLPGITGWAQVNGSRGEVDTLDKARRRVALDLWYIANWSPLLDLWIILRTAFGGFVTFRAD